MKKNPTFTRFITASIAVIIALSFGPAALDALAEGPPFDASIDLKANLTAHTPEVRVIHLAMDAPSVDIWVDKRFPAFFELEYGKTTKYALLDSVFYVFDVVGAGNNPINGSALTEPTYMLPRKSYTIAAYNTLQDLKAITLIDDYRYVRPEHIRIRPVHVALGIGTVDVWLLPQYSQPLIAWQNLNVGEAGWYAEVPAQPYVVGLDVDNDRKLDVVFLVPTLPVGSIINAFATVDADYQIKLAAQFETDSIVMLNSRMPADVAAMGFNLNVK